MRNSLQPLPTKNLRRIALTWAALVLALSTAQADGNRIGDGSGNEQEQAGSEKTSQSTSSPKTSAHYQQALVLEQQLLAKRKPTIALFNQSRDEVSLEKLAQAYQEFSDLFWRMQALSADTPHNQKLRDTAAELSRKLAAREAVEREVQKQRNAAIIRKRVEKEIAAQRAKQNEIRCDLTPAPVRKRRQLRLEIEARRQRHIHYLKHWQTRIELLQRKRFFDNYMVSQRVPRQGHEAASGNAFIFGQWRLNSTLEQYAQDYAQDYACVEVANGLHECSKSLDLSGLEAALVLRFQDKRLQTVIISKAKLSPQQRGQWFDMLNRMRFVPLQIDTSGRWGRQQTLAGSTRERYTKLQSMPWKKISAVRLGRCDAPQIKCTPATANRLATLYGNEHELAIEFRRVANATPAGTTTLKSR